jgi:hypothetical protein
MLQREGCAHYQNWSKTSSAIGGHENVIATQRHWWGFALWMLAFWFCIVGALVAFEKVAPWTSAISTAEAEAQWPGRIDPSWRAVSPNHGRPQEWPYGTVADNRGAFLAWLSCLVSSAGGVWFCYVRLKWYIEPPERR